MKQHLLLSAVCPGVSGTSLMAPTLCVAFGVEEEEESLGLNEMLGCVEGLPFMAGWISGFVTPAYRHEHAY